MARKRKKQHHEEHIDETWLIPYADLLTLLLALFIVLFAMSSVDAIKFKQMAQSFQSTFNGGTGVMKYPSPLPQDQLESLNREDAENERNQEPMLEEKKLADLQQKINSYIDIKDLNLELKTTLTEDGLMLSILNDFLFESGTAELEAEDRQLAREISQLLVMEVPREIVISGHTDNIPIYNAKFKSNWELSVMRAVNFMKIVMQNEELDPRLFSVKGFGEYKPLVSNDTPEGRKANRRVEILIKANELELPTALDTQLTN